MESYIEYLGDIIDDIHLLFDEDEPSSVVLRAHFNPSIHSLHDQSYQVDMIVDPYVQQLQEVSLSFEEMVLWDMLYIHPCYNYTHSF